MQKLFILGTGFSKAVSESMHTGCVVPTMKELGEHVKNRIHELPELPSDPGVYESLVSDPNNVEDLLTYTYGAMPWQLPHELHLHKSAFLILSDIIAEYITECEENVFCAESPEWAKKFVQYLHDEKATVATFNYDTVLERISLKTLEAARITDVGDFYRSPIMDLIYRDGKGRFSPASHETYRLLKLHGSINWYFPGDENAPGQQVYYSNELLRGEAARPKHVATLNRNKIDLVHLIVPPVAEKSLFYNTGLLRALWRGFLEAVQTCDEVYCVGYSLPITDLSTRAFFSTVMNRPDKTVYLVNLKGGSRELVPSYRRALPNCQLITDYISDCGPIESMVADLE